MRLLRQSWFVDHPSISGSSIVRTRLNFGKTLECPRSMSCHMTCHENITHFRKWPRFEKGIFLRLPKTRNNERYVLLLLLQHCSLQRHLFLLVDETTNKHNASQHHKGNEATNKEDDGWLYFPSRVEIHGDFSPSWLSSGTRRESRHKLAEESSRPNRVWIRIARQGMEANKLRVYSRWFGRLKRWKRQTKVELDTVVFVDGIFCLGTNLQNHRRII